MAVLPQVVFITGASSGIGAACARRFGAAGSRVVLAGRRKDRLLALSQQLPCKSHVLELDVRDVLAVSKVFDSLPDEFLAVDLLLNNAGLALGLNPAQRASLEQWDEMIETNVRGLTHLTHAVLPGMVTRGRGHIINIGSVAGTYPYPGGNVYGATKAFVRQFSLNLRADLLGTPLRVTNVEPGMVGETEFSLVRFQGDQAQVANVYRDLQPLLPEDVAETVFFCATCPPHLNVNSIELMPVAQAFGPLAVSREQR